MSVEVHVHGHKQTCVDLGGIESHVHMPDKRITAHAGHVASQLCASLDV